MSDERMAVVRDMLLEAGFPPLRIDLALQVLAQEPLLVQASDYYVRPSYGADEPDLMGSALVASPFSSGRS